MGPGHLSATVLFFVVEMPFAINVPQSRYQNVEIVYLRWLKCNWVCIEILYENETYSVVDVNIPVFEDVNIPVFEAVSDLSCSP